jgi:hypothetical protein
MRVGAGVVHPAGLPTIPVRQDAAAEQVRFRGLVRRAADGGQELHIHAVVVVHESYHVGDQAWHGAVEGVGLARCGFGEPGQWQPGVGFLLLAIMFKENVGVIRAGVGDHHDVHFPAFRPAGGIQGDQRPRKQIGAVMRADEDAQSWHGIFSEARLIRAWGRKPTRGFGRGNT